MYQFQLQNVERRNYLPPPSDCLHRFHPEPTKRSDLKVLFPNAPLNIQLEEITALTVTAGMLCLSPLSDHREWV